MMIMIIINKFSTTLRGITLNFLKAVGSHLAGIRLSRKTLFGQNSVLWWWDWSDLSKIWKTCAAQTTWLCLDCTDKIQINTRHLNASKPTSNINDFCLRSAWMHCQKFDSVDSQPPSMFHSGFPVWIYFHSIFCVLI